MAGAFLTRRLSDIGKIDPNALPDLGFGPMTADTRAGVPNQDFQSVDMPSLTDRLLAGAELPARLYKGAFDTATNDVARAGEDPSIENLAAAGANTGMVVGSPALSLGSAALGYGNAALQQLKDALASPVEAKKRPSGGVPSPQVGGISVPAPSLDSDPVWQKVKDDPELAALYQQIQKTSDAATKDYPGKQLATGERLAARAALDKLQAQFSAALAARTSKTQGLYDQQVADAKAMRDAELAKQNSFESTPVGRAYSRIGIAPLLLGGLGGTLSKLSGGGKGLLGDIPGLVATGVTGAGANLAPTIYNHKYAPYQNPEKQAYQVYSKFLPEGHPDKAKAEAYANVLPDVNPVYKGAEEGYKPQNLMLDAGGGALEAMSGYKFGKMLTPAIGGLGRAESYGFPPGAKPPSVVSRVEPTLTAPEGAFSANPQAQKMIADAVPTNSPATKSNLETLADQVSGSGAKLPTSKKAFNAIDLMTKPTGKKPVPAGRLVSSALDKVDSQQTIADIMKVAPAGTKRADVAKLVKANPNTPVPDIMKQITQMHVTAAKAPGTLSKALQNKFGPLNPAND